MSFVFSILPALAFMVMGALTATEVVFPFAILLAGICTTFVVGAPVAVVSAIVSPISGGLLSVICIYSGRGAYGKTIVFGMKKRGDKVYTQIVNTFVFINL
jgi:hypothetical protein